MKVFVAASGEIYNNGIVRSEFFPAEHCQGVGALESRYDAFHAGKCQCGVERLCIGYGKHLGAPRCREESVERADARIIETGRYGIGFNNLSVGGLHDQSTGTVDYSLRADMDCGGSLTGTDSLSRCLGGDKANGGFVNE